MDIQSAETARVARRTIADLRDEPSIDVGNDDQGSLIPLMYKLSGEEPFEDWPNVDAHLASELETSTPRPVGLTLAELVARRRKWTSLAPYFRVIASFETAAAADLAAFIAHNTM